MIGGGGGWRGENWESAAAGVGGFRYSKGEDEFAAVKFQFLNVLPEQPVLWMRTISRAWLTRAQGNWLFVIGCE